MSVCLLDRMQKIYNCWNIFNKFKIGALQKNLSTHSKLKSDKNKQN
jgi:hypothetical protein